MMDEALQARTAARAAVDDITPDRLRAVLDDHLADASMIPGVLTILSARVADGSVDADAIERRAAGVQLIYEGLRLTRTLVAEEPWAGESDVDDDLDVLAADVLVSRGFRLLARTEAADQAVETVREFGRERTDLQEGRTTTAGSLEANVFELAAIAGSSATGSEAPLALRQYVTGLAGSIGDPPLPAAEDGLPETIEDVLARVGQATGGDEAVRPQSATDH